MASKKISELNSASTLTGAERFLIVQSGDNRQLTLDTLLAGLTTSAAVNPTLTLTSNAFIVKGTGGNTTNGIMRIQGNASNLPTLLLSNSTGAKFTFAVGDTATFGGTALTLVESWNNAAQIFNSIDLQITNTTSNTASRVLSVKIGGSQVAAIDSGGNIWSQANYPRFATLGFVGTFNGITVNTQSLPLTGTLNLSYAQLSQTSMIYLNQSGNASYDVTLPTTGLSDSDSGKMWTFVINQATAFSQTIFPLNAGERGTKFFRYRTGAQIGAYILQFAYLKVSGVGQWYPVTGAQFQTSGSSTVPTQGVLLYDV